MSVDYAFGSDNHSGVHSQIMDAINNVNTGYAIAYGDDDITQQAIKTVKKYFGSNTEVFFLYNGTAANILGLKVVTHSHHAILCANTAHLYVHECCGPEKFLGCKLVPITTPDGKLTINLIQPYLIGFDDPHMAQPKVISITQPTERGTLYTLQELKTLGTFAHKNNMLLHMDGARLCNAAAALNISLKELTEHVDVLSFGGTKNGMLCGEAVIFFKSEYAQNFQFIRKQGMQLASKMRYLSTQFQAFFTNDLWLKNAQHANDMASYLAKQLKKIPDVTITQKVQANAVFAIIPEQHIKRLQKYYFFHIFDEHKAEARFMCSYNTTKEQINNFIETIKNVINK